MDTLEMWGPVCPAEDHFIISSYVAKGLPSEAIERAERAVEQFKRTPRLLAALAEAYASNGQTAEVEAILSELEEAQKERYVDPTIFALIHLNLGDYDAAIDMLEQGYEIRSAWLPTTMAIDPRTDPLRDDPRFQDLLRRMGLGPERSGGLQEEV
jgi:tetratricopeptide (TPR) repeat protein